MVTDSPDVRNAFGPSRDLSSTGYSQPDSIALGRDSVFIGFQNHAAKDGSDGKSSTIVEYSLKGAVKRKFSVKGHNDGLRVVGEDNLWALQNEDANPNLVIIHLHSGGQQTEFVLPAPHGGGYDDLRVVQDQIFMTASNPLLDHGVNHFPALVRLRLAGYSVVLDPVLKGDAAAIDIPTGRSITLNLTDPDSLSVDQRGNLVLNSQADAQLVFIRHPLMADQTVGRISITTATRPTTVDDTAFAPEGQSFALFSDVKADKVYRLDAPKFGFEPGTAYCTSDTAGIVGVLNLDNGVLAPIATGFGSTRGMVFVSEPSHPLQGR
jgi:sugar lactone lactonase YvrE